MTGRGGLPTGQDLIRAVAVGVLLLCVAAPLSKELQAQSVSPAPDGSAAAGSGTSPSPKSDPAKPASRTPTPVQPNSPSPLQPLSASPAGPDSASSHPQPPPLFAQSPSALQESVENRSRPEFQPEGIELDRLLSLTGIVDPASSGKRNPLLSSFIVSPRIEFDLVHDSNLFRTADATSDRIAVAKPALEIRSDWSSHSLSAAVESEIGRHQKNPTEDYEDLGLRLGGSAELFDATKVTAGVGLRRNHSQRGEILDPGTADGPAISWLSSVQLGIEHRLEPLDFRLNYTGSNVNYLSSATTDNDDLDRTDGRVALRVGFEIDQGTSLFVEPAYNWKTYDRAVDRAGVLQDNDGVEVLAGVTWDVSSVTFFEFALGYLRQEFDDPALSTIQGPSLSARLIWNPSDLWTVTLNSRRTIQETATPGQAGVLVTATDAKIDYEFLYNTIVSVSAAYADEDQSGSNQTDTRTSFGLKIRHLLNRNLYLQLDGSLIELSSTDPAAEFEAFTTSLRLGVNL